MSAGAPCQQDCCQTLSQLARRAPSACSTAHILQLRMHRMAMRSSAPPVIDNVEWLTLSHRMPGIAPAPACLIHTQAILFSLPHCLQSQAAFAAPLSKMIASSITRLARPPCALTSSRPCLMTNTHMQKLPNCLSGQPPLTSLCDRAREICVSYEEMGASTTPVLSQGSPTQTST